MSPDSTDTDIDPNRVVIHHRTGTTVVELEERDLTGSTITFTCSSGDRFGATWEGIPMSALVADIDLPADTTHLQFHSRDGFRVCIAIDAAMDGFLALRQNGEAVREPPRLVSPSIAGQRTIKGVVEIQPLTLAPHESPEEYENIVEMVE